MLKCLIIDDEPLAIHLLSGYVRRHPLCELVAAFTQPVKALQALDTLSVDLILLDVQMPELSGMQFAQIVQPKYPVILTTAYETFAVQGYQLEVIDYLLKPITYERFSAAIHLACRKIDNEAGKGVSSADSSGAPAFIFVKSGFQTLRIDLDAVLFLEGYGDYVRIHTVSGQVLTLDKLKHFEQILPPAQFIRVHKSYIISLPKIDRIEAGRIFIGKKVLPIGASYGSAFWKRISGDPV